MTTKFIQDGESIDYIPGSAKTAGAVVVQNHLVGVQKRDIAANSLGALAVSGVFDFPKATGGGTAIAAGKPVYYDVANDVATESTASGANKLIGKTILAAADADAKVRVKLLQ